MTFNINAARFVLALAALIIPACGGSNPGPSDAPVEVAFIANGTVAGTDELYAADLAGTRVVSLSGPLVAGGHVTLMSWSSDGSKIAFLADKEVDETFELYVAAASGGAPVKVSGALVAGGNVKGFAWSHDGSRIAYTADQDVDGKVELYTSLASGAGNVKVSGAIPTGGGVDLFNWAPDGSRIAYRVTGNALKQELHTNLPAGGGDVTVSGIAAAADLPIRFTWSPNSSRLAFENYEDGLSGAELYTVAPNGTSKVRVSGGVGVASDAILGAWAPDGSRLAYLLHISGSPTVLYTVKPDGSDSAPFVASGVPTWAPDGSRLAYVADAENDGSLDLHTAKPDGTEDKIVSLPMVKGGNVGWYNGNGLSFAWSPDSQRIAYYADQEVDGTIDLYDALAAGGQNHRVSNPLPAGALMAAYFRWSPDSARLAYEVDGTGSDLFTATPNGALNSATQVSILPASGSVGIFIWSNDGARIVFTNAGQLYSTLAQGGDLALIGGASVKAVVIRP